MSRSENAKRTEGHLLVEAPLGFHIAIANSAFTDIASGITRLKATLPEGVYVVRWSGAQQSRRWIVRLRGEETLRIDPSTEGYEAEGEQQHPELPRIAEIVADAVPLSKTMLVVAVLSHDDVRRDLSEVVKVQTSSKEEVAPRSDFRQRDASWALTAYDLQPGIWSIGYESFERHTMQQTIYLPVGRRTVVLLRYGRASVVERGKTDVRIRKRRGIDPARTIVMSLPDQSSTAKFLEDVTTAEILLHLLRTRSASLDIDTAATLVQAGVDPYLQMYAAAGVLARGGTAVERLAAVISEGAADPSGSVAIANRLLDRLTGYPDWPDVCCLSWRLERAGHGSNPLRQLPMLEIAWRWASAHSVREPDSFQLEAMATAAALDADPSAVPWFVVPSHPAEVEVENSASVDQLSAEIIALAQGLAHVFARGVNTDGFEDVVPAVDISQLSDTTGEIIRAVLASGGPQVWSRSDDDLVRHLAATLGKPIARLVPTLQGAVKDIRNLVKRDQDAASGLWESDPWKDQFGGSPTCGGATLALERHIEQEGLEFLALNLAVITAANEQKVEGSVTFYLHPTFSPSVETVRAIDGRATFTCYAWGAFTVGAETSDGRRMELDLAAQAELPQWFRER
jgi:hypothetical protein